MRLRIVLLGVFSVWIAAGVAGRASAQDSAQIAQGKAVFHQVCAPCHGTGPGTDGATSLPGTAALAIKYKGQIAPLLEQRSDLSADTLKDFVRHGTGAMPMFRKTEITDSQIEAVAAYLAKSAKENPYVPPDSTKKKPSESH
jgi:mono/diheme cytochrome c family protein